MAWAYWGLALFLRNSGCLLLTVSLLAACHRDETPSSATAHPHYQLGNAWHGARGWFYPHEQFTYRATGIATREVRMTDRLTADGEAWSANSMTGAHQTLQLPAIVTVRNLQNGRIVTIRLNARGPDSPGRIIAISPKAADLLGMTSDTPVEIVEDEAASHQLAESLNGAPAGDVQKAPVGEVQAESLSDGSKQIFGNSPLPAQTVTASLAALSVTWQQSMSGPSGLYVLLGLFSGHAAAQQVALRCGGQVVRAYDGAGLDWKVRSGPYGDVAQADAALDQTRACGVDGARIIVE